MKKENIKPNLAGILLIVFGVIVIMLSILFFAVDPARVEKEIQTRQVITI